MRILAVLMGVETGFAEPDFEEKRALSKHWHFWSVTLHASPSH